MNIIIIIVHSFFMSAYLISIYYSGSGQNPLKDNYHNYNIYTDHPVGWLEMGLMFP